MTDANACFECALLNDENSTLHFHKLGPCANTFS